MLGRLWQGRRSLPEEVAGATLGRRLSWIMAARLLFLGALLMLIANLHVGDGGSAPFTVRVGLVTLCVAFALTAGYALVLRTRRHLERLAHAQIVFDQLTWTVAAYLSGGAVSGATSLYGLSCLVGAMLTGVRGAALAAVVGAINYTLLVVALGLRWVEPPPDQPLALYQISVQEAVYYLLTNLLVIVVVSVLAGYLAERLRLTGGRLVQAEERAEQAEQMAVLGRLAAGLAHEIRNPLGSIAGSIQLLRSSPALSAEERDLCDIVQREAARLNDLVSDMTDLSRPRRPVLRRIDLARIAREVVELASKSGRAVTDVGVRYLGEEQLFVQGDEAQLRQLVWNLVRNAVQASTAGDTVDVSVTVEERRARLRVVDRGIGLDPTAQARIFDAFYTTRSQGTGLGLAVVKRIADEHGFSITVRSSAGQGATFELDVGAPEAAPQTPGPGSSGEPRPSLLRSPV